MTDLQFDKWMSLNEQFKKVAFLAMDVNNQTDCLNRVSALDGGESFCCQCPHWNQTGDGYGICQNPNAQRFQESTNGANECYSDQVSDALRIINEAISSQIRYSRPSGI